MISELQIELTNVCNSNCQFCPRHSQTSTGKMSDKLYEKILLDATKRGVESITPTGFGEPFTDPQFIERVKLAHKIFPDARMVIYTNGSLIKDEHILELAGIKKLHMAVSLNAARPETRKHLMGLDDFHKVKDTIDKIVAAGIQCRTTMVFFPSMTLEEAQEFGSFHNPKILRFQSFSGLTYRYKRTIPTSCKRLKEDLFFRWNGDATLCCFDVTSKVLFGNMNDCTIEEIWQKKSHYRAIHELHAGQTMKMCEACTEMG